MTSVLKGVCRLPVDSGSNKDGIMELILGRRDEGVQIFQCQNQLYYKDGDGDGYGDPDQSKEGCYLPVGYVENNYDAFPLDSSRHLDTDGDTTGGVDGGGDTDGDSGGDGDGDVSSGSASGGGCSLNFYQ